jgi:glycolate oxidase FAD binding subunit
VDGRGVPFKGGGRVVKNVAGYDFCKLLTGSLGTLGVITQLAFKVKPRPEQSAAIAAACSDLAVADRMLCGFAEFPATLAAIDLLIGAAWDAQIRNPQSDGSSPAVAGNHDSTLVVRIEGTEAEVAWLAEQVQHALTSNGGTCTRRLNQTADEALWRRQVEFSDSTTLASVADTRNRVSESRDHVNADSPLVIKIAVPPSAVLQVIAQLLEFDPDCTIQAHAGNGIIVARFKRFRDADLSSVLVGKLRPAAVRLGGSLVVVSSTLEGLTPHLIWGGRTDAVVLMEHIKQKFDPKNILNPGRFVF